MDDFILLSLHFRSAFWLDARFLLTLLQNILVVCSISLKFFAKEDTDGQEGFLSPITVDVEQGLAHEYKQRSGTGIDISTLEINHGVNPLEIWMEVSSGNKSGGSCPNFQINYVTFEMDNGEYTPRVQKQITVVDGQKWEIHDTYESELCAICFDAPANVIIIPCGHKVSSLFSA